MRNCSISLDDKWTVTQGRVMMNGTQALARVMLAQAWLDKRDGLDTAGYIGGYRGSPIGNVDTTLWSIGKHLDAARVRSEERRVGKESVSPCRYRWSPFQ